MERNVTGQIMRDCLYCADWNRYCVQLLSDYYQLPLISSANIALIGHHQITDQVSQKQRLDNQYVGNKELVLKAKESLHIITYIKQR